MIMLLGQTDLVESSENTIRAVSSLSGGLKTSFELYFLESLKLFCENVNYLL